MIGVEPTLLSGSEQKFGFKRRQSHNTKSNNQVAHPLQTSKSPQFETRKLEKESSSIIQPVSSNIEPSKISQIEKPFQRKQSNLSLAGQRNLDSHKPINFNNRDVKIKRLTRSTTSLQRMRNMKLQKQLESLSKTPKNANA